MPVAGDIEWHLRQGVVELTCGEEAFARLWAAVGDAAGPAVAPVGAVDVVVLRRARPAPPPTPWQDRLALVGCGTATLVVLLLLGAGAHTVSSWVW